MLIYVSGPMTGYPKWNYPAFREAALCLRENGHIVLNPAETAGGSTHLTRSQFLYIDIGYVQAAEALVVLPGWKQSRGALLEVHIAHSLEKPVFWFDPEVGLGPQIEIERFGVIVTPQQAEMDLDYD